MQIEEKRKKDCLKREEDKKYVTEDRRRAVVLNAKAEELEKVIITKHIVIFWLVSVRFWSLGTCSRWKWDQRVSP